MRLPWQRRSQSEELVAAPNNETPETRQFVFTAQSISLSDIFADITAEVVADENVRIEMEGLPSQLNRIGVKSSDSDIQIKGSPPRNFTLVRTTRARTIFQISRLVDVRVIQEETPLSIRLFLPKGTSLSLQEVDGRITIGDTEGRLKVSGSNSCPTTIGNVADLKICHEGSGDMTIASAHGDVVIENSYTGDITVQQVTGQLTIENDGSGDVKVLDGHVSEAHLTLSYTGQVSYLGSTAKAALNSDGSGNFIHNGTVGLAHITIDYTGDVRIGNITKRYQRHGDGSGELIIRDEEPMPTW